MKNSVKNTRTKKHMSWQESKNVKLRTFRDNEYDILSFYWGDKCEHSREIKASILLDFDKDNNIIGIEIYDFINSMLQSQKEYDRLFKLAKKHERKKPKKHK